MRAGRLRFEQRDAFVRDDGHEYRDIPMFTSPAGQQTTSRHDETA